MRYPLLITKFSGQKRGVNQLRSRQQQLVDNFSLSNSTSRYHQLSGKIKNIYPSSYELPTFAFNFLRKLASNRCQLTVLLTFVFKSLISCSSMLLLTFRQCGYRGVSLQQMDVKMWTDLTSICCHHRMSNGQQKVKIEIYCLLIRVVYDFIPAGT